MTTRGTADVLMEQQNSMAQARNRLGGTLSALSTALARPGMTSQPGPLGDGESVGWAPDNPENPSYAGMNDTRSWNSNNTRGSLAWGGFSNGQIPTESLTQLAPGHYLESSAASSFLDMATGARQAGVSLPLSSSYRDYDRQVWVRENLGNSRATATPGTSIHGWGKAIDVKGAAAQAWMRSNGAAYGWVWPSWAQQPGKNYEPWHWEYRPTTPTALPGKVQTAPQTARPASTYRTPPAVAAKPLGNLEVT